MHRLIPLFAFLLLAPRLDAQTPAVSGAADPASLARRVVERFASGTPEAFDSVYPEPEARQLVRNAVQRGWPRTAGEARVLAAGADRAVLLLTGMVTLGHSADETLLARYFSGVYEAAPAGGEWRLVRRLPLEGGSRIAAHALHAVLLPGEALAVVDTLTVRVGNAYGLAVRLNHRARLDGVAIGGRPVEHVFSGGVLWMAAPAGEARVRVAYRLNVERDTADTESGSFQPDYGHLRNSYVWHPFFDFGTAADRANFTVRVRAPAAYHVATTLPQTSEVHGAERIVTARTAAPTSTLSLLYDRAWRPAAAEVEGMRLETFVTPEFQPGHDSLAAAAARVVRLYRRHFGEPRSRHLFFGEARAQRGGFMLRTNDLVFSGRGGGAVGGGGAEPNSSFAHEISHGWVRGTGPGANFINEGFATSAEALAIGDAYGADAERVFWERARNRYHLRGHQGRTSIVGERFGNLISYTKGAWVWRMLRHVMGDDAFRRGLLAFRDIPAGEPAGVEELGAALSAAAGRDLGPFLRPWLQETVIPDVRARVEDGRVVVIQHGPLFSLPLELELTTARGPVRRRVELAERETVVDVRDVGAVTAVRVDPDHHFLLRRHWGEAARFELAAPDAQRVQLLAEFAAEPIAATRTGDVWKVDVPLTEGTYLFWWMVDGRRLPGDPGVRIVRPAQPVENAYPR